MLADMIYACSPGLYKPTQEQANASGVSLEELQNGRELYVAHCNSCHTLYYPKQFNEAKWKENLDEMQSKAEISNREKELILQYLLNND